MLRGINHNNNPNTTQQSQHLNLIGTVVIGVVIGDIYIPITTSHRINNE